MDFLINLFYFALVLCTLVFVHELGHLLAAKYFGVYCKEFAIGMGPTLFKIKKPHWETTYSIRALPLGGFVSMAGEPGEGDMGVDASRTMVGIARWKRLIIMLAGIFMNLVLAFCIYTGMFAVNGTVVMPKAEIATVMEGTPAEKAGFQVGDVITKLTFYDGTQTIIEDIEDLQVGLAVYADRPVTVTLDRKGTEVNTELTPELNAETNSYIIGIQTPPLTQRSVGFLEAITLSFAQIGSVVSQMLFLLTRMIKGIGVENLGGPVAIFGVTSEIATYGIQYFFNLVALLSVNLAVINLLPIPVMDGGRVVITVVEMIFRRPIPEKLENIIMSASIALMLAFFLFVTYNDLFNR